MSSLSCTGERGTFLSWLDSHVGHSTVMYSVSLLSRICNISTPGPCAITITCDGSCLKKDLLRRNTCDLYFHDFSITLKLNFSFLTHLTSNKSGVMKRICQKGKVRFQGDTEIMKIQLILRHDVVSKHHVSSPGPKSCSDKRLLLDVFCVDDQDPAAEILLELWNADKGYCQ